MNYAPQDARMIILLQRRRVTGKDAAQIQADGKRYVYDILPYYQVLFDVDQPGEPVVYFEFWSENDTTTWAGDNRNFPQPAYPIIEWRIVDGQPNPDVFYVAQ